MWSYSSTLPQHGSAPVHVVAFVIKAARMRRRVAPPLLPYRIKVPLVCKVQHFYGHKHESFWFMHAYKKLKVDEKMILCH